MPALQTMIDRLFRNDNHDICDYKLVDAFLPAVMQGAFVSTAAMLDYLEEMGVDPTIIATQRLRLAPSNLHKVFKELMLMNTDNRVPITEFSESRLDHARRIICNEILHELFPSTYVSKLLNIFSVYTSTKLNEDSIVTRLIPPVQ